MEKDLRDAALLFIKELINLKQGEKLLIYVDKGSDLDVAKIISETAKTIKAPTELFEINSNLKLPDMARELIHKIEKGAFDVICELSEQYFYHTPAWQRALQLGSRIYSLAGMNTEGFIRCVGKVNHSLMFKFGMILKKMLQQSKMIRIITTKGTNLRVNLNRQSLVLRLISKFKKKHRPWVIEPSGMLTEATKSTFLGGQLAFQGFSIATEGTVVIDGYLWPPPEIGRLDDPLVLNVRKGEVVSIDGCPVRSRVLNAWLAGKNKDVQHFCIGFNPGAQLTGSLIEAERVFGTISIGIGTYPFHTDGVIMRPSILLNGVPIEEEGSFIHEELSNLQQNLMKPYPASVWNHKVIGPGT